MTTKTYTVQQIRQMLMGASFETWYEQDFMDHVTGEEDAKSDDQIEADLEQMLR